MKRCKSLGRLPPARHLAHNITIVAHATQRAHDASELTELLRDCAPLDGDIVGKRDYHAKPWFHERGDAHRASAAKHQH